MTILPGRTAATKEELVEESEDWCLGAEWSGGHWRENRMLEQASQARSVRALCPAVVGRAAANFR